MKGSKGNRVIFGKVFESVIDDNRAPDDFGVGEFFAGQ
jgi:hypothetical protein